MATDYYGTPSFLERVVGAELVVIGRPRRLLRVDPLRVEDGSRVYGIFEVAVDSVLMGDPSSDVLRLRVLGEGRDEQAAWIVPLDENEPFLFLLARDVEPEASDTLYVPVFSGVYPLTDEDHLDVPEEALDEPTRERIGLEGDRLLSLGGVRRLIESLFGEREDRLRQLEEMGLTELLDRPYPPIREIPQEDRPFPPVGGIPQEAETGGRPATVEQTVDPQLTD